MIKRAAWFTIIVLATLVVLALLWQFREAVGLFVLSLGVGAAARPLVDRLASRRVPRGVGLALVYLGTVAGLVALLAVFGGSILTEIGRFSDRFVSFYDHLWAAWPTGSGLQQAIVKNLPPPSTLYQAITGEQGGALVQTLLGVTLSSLAVLSQFVAILVLSIYWSIDQAHFERLWLSLLPTEQRTRTRTIWREIESGVGAYIRSELLQSVLAGFLLGIGFWLLGLDYPVTLAIVGAVAWLIPWLGAIIALVPIILTGLQGGWVVAASAAGYTIAILLFLELVVEPRLYSRRQYSSLLTVILMLGLADVLGLVGLLLAPPLAAAIQILFASLLRNQVIETGDSRAKEIASLETRLEDLRRLAAERETELAPQTINLMDRLQQILQKARGEITSS
jgi:putative permease